MEFPGKQCGEMDVEPGIRGFESSNVRHSRSISSWCTRNLVMYHVNAVGFPIDDEGRK